MAERIATVDVVLVGAGIMSATLGMLLKELQPDISISIFERLDMAAAESSDAWNNAGTGHSDGAERNETVFNFVAADQTGNHAANTDSDGESRVQVSGLGRPTMEYVGPVHDHRGKKKRTEEPEVGVAKYSEKERLILPHDLHLLPEIADEVGTKFLIGCGRRDPVYPKACA